MLAQIGSDLAGYGEREQRTAYMSEGETGFALGNPGLRQRHGYTLWELII